MVLFLSLIFCAFAGCATSRPPAAWKPKTWAGAPEKAGIERAQDKAVLQCSDPAFSHYVCMSDQDIVNLGLKCGSAK